METSPGRRSCDSRCLDRALFSPGIIDGRWGGNTEKALYWFQQREGLPGTARLDRTTFERLVQVAGSPRAIARQHQLTADDVAGPFIDLPPPGVPVLFRNTKGEADVAGVGPGAGGGTASEPAEAPARR